MLKPYFSAESTEAGCDEAGRGCLAGPVFAAAVILPGGYINPRLNDSKVLSASTRKELRMTIESSALSWGVGTASPEEIDRINILQASVLAMHRALDKLSIRPDLILVDGNRFSPYRNIRNVCIVKGDASFLSIAAASILAKTHRDEFMETLHEEFPEYGWLQNKGYPTGQHKDAIFKHGVSPWHRKSFRVSKQFRLDF